MLAETKNAAPSFTAQCWIQNGGAALALDNSPNVTPPAANRIISTPDYIFNMPFPDAAGGVPMATTVQAFLADGTTATLRLWMYDDGQATWIPMANQSARTYATFNGHGIPCRTVPGAKFFCQVIANNGVTKIAFFLH